MSNARVWVAGLVIVAGSVLGGCASSGYDAAGYTTTVKDGRLWVFVPNSSEHQRFKRNGELAKTVTRPAAGPNGMTVVAETGVDLDKYLAAVGK